MEVELEKEFTCCSLLLLWRETVLKVFFMSSPLESTEIPHKDNQVYSVSFDSILRLWGSQRCPCW